MQKEQIIAWLNERKHIISISKISKTTGVPRLHKILNAEPDAKGYPAKLADKHVPALEKFITDFCKMP